jgi:hypothetical protein
MTLYNSAKLIRELEAAGIPVEGCDSTGAIQFKADATQADRARAAQVLASHDPAPRPGSRVRDLSQADLVLLVERMAMMVGLADGGGRVLEERHEEGPGSAGIPDGTADTEVDAVATDALNTIARTG